MKNLTLRKILLTALFSSLALISFMLESLLPPIILPSARLGLSNVFILLTLIILGEGWAFAVLLVKVILGSLFAGNISAVMYSLPSGVVALAIEIIFFRFPKRFGVLAISITGAVINIVVQNVIFCLITATYQYLLYTPYLALIGVLGGIVVGFAVYLIVRFLPTKIINQFICADRQSNKRSQTKDENGLS